MPSVCLYLQIHQPFRLRKYTVFDSDPHYFDDGLNAQIVRRVAEKCYLPMTRLLLDLIREHAPRFKIALSITGTAMEQFEHFAPEVVQALHVLAESRGVEFLGETFHHSLAALHSPAEFREQVDLHRRMIKRLFGQTPTVFRNTELIYSNQVAALAAEAGFDTILAEGWDPVLNNRSAAFLYRAVPAPPQGSPLNASGDRAAPVLLLRNYRLSDAIAFRFADPRASDFPLTVERFAQMVEQIGGQWCNLFMDCETFGEHYAAETGIFDFFRGLPGKLLERNSVFALPGEIIRRSGSAAEAETAGELDVPHAISWADESRDLGAWMGNAMQTNALQELYALEPAVKKHGDARLLADWRKLTTSDHTYYMSTRDNADGMVHAHFRPYESPYDAYINFMNVLDHLRGRLA